MNGEATIIETTDKTTVNSEADLSSDVRRTIIKTTNENTESADADLWSDEETNSTASRRKPSELSSPELQPQSK